MAFDFVRRELAVVVVLAVVFALLTGEMLLVLGEVCWPIWLFIGTLGTICFCLSTLVPFFRPLLTTVGTAATMAA